MNTLHGAPMRVMKINEANIKLKTSITNETEKATVFGEFTERVIFPNAHNDP